MSMSYIFQSYHLPLTWNTDCPQSLMSCPWRTFLICHHHCHFGISSMLPSNNAQVWRFIKGRYYRLSGSLSVIHLFFVLSIIRRDKMSSSFPFFLSQTLWFVFSCLSFLEVFKVSFFNLFPHVCWFVFNQDALGIVIQTPGWSRKRCSQDLFRRSKFKIRNGRQSRRHRANRSYHRFQRLPPFLSFSSSVSRNSASRFQRFGSFCHQEPEVRDAVYNR